MGGEGQVDAFAATAPLVSIDALASSADARDRVVVEHAAALFLERGIADVKMTDIADPAKYESQWPSNAGYGNGKRPRSATIVITRNDGGVIGS